MFAGRDSSGVRGIRLAAGDEVNSLCVLNHVDADVAERAAYLRMASARRRVESAAEEASTEPEPADDGVEDAALSEDGASDASISNERFAELEAAEEVLLTVTNGGFGKRSSAYDYRVSGRGGQGIANVTLAPRNGTAVVATLPVLNGTDVMLMTDAGRLIRVPVDQVRVTARQSMGVTLFRLSDAERVASVFPVIEEEAADEGPGEVDESAGGDSGDISEDDDA